MESLVIAPTDETLGLDFNPNTGKIQLSGISMPEDALDFFRPALIWAEDYVKNPAPSTEVVCAMDYFNTPSSRPIIRFLSILEEIHQKGGDITIVWCFYDDDEDMQDTGIEFSEIVKVPFREMVLN